MPIGYNMECPKCHYNRNDQDMECPRCGIIYDKYELLIKKKEENDNRDPNGPAQNPASSQNPSTNNLLYKLKYYLGGITLGIITAVLIIYYYNSNISRLIEDNNRTAVSTGLQGTPSGEYGPETEYDPQDFSSSPEDALSDSHSIYSPDSQGNASPSKNKIEEACRAVVTIKTTSGFGSGFFINEDGYILTNRHVSKMNEDVQDTLYDMRETLRGQIKENEELMSNIETELANKKNDIETEETWISENTDGRYYSKREIDEKVAEIKTHQSQRQSLIREYNNLMIQYNTEKAKNGLLQQRYKEIRSQIDNLAYNASLMVYLADGTKKTAAVISNSTSYDMALLKIDGVKTPFINPADDGKLKVGDTLYAIGTPQGFSQTVTSGILSSFRDGYIQTNAQISPGNSGGPLINSEGKAVGINTSKIVAEGVEGIGFAIPINVVVQEYNQYFY
jgi:S1-C subfamily serine protease